MDRFFFLAGDPMRDDNELMSAIVNGDNEAFAELYDRHNRRLTRWIYGKARDWQLAEDISQSSWLNIHLKADSYGSGTSFSSWARRIFLNAFIDNRRRAKTRKFDMPSPGSDDGCNWIENNLASEQVDQIGRQIDIEEAAKIEAILPSLPHEQSAAFELFVFAEMSMSEIAAAMGIPVATAKSRVRLAREKIHAGLGGVVLQPEPEERSQNHSKVIHA
jgi:RNA polymerase sigma-70 factor (ECF subfamily)